MYYVGAYYDSAQTIQHRFVGWSKNKLAVNMYNVAGHNTGAFYDHYEIFEYDCSKEEFIQAIKDEWGEDISDWEMNGSYIDIYETSHGDYLSITNEEYKQLVAWTDIDYEMGISYMRTLYEMIGLDLLELILNGQVINFIAYIAATYLEIFSDVNNLSSRIDKLQAFVCRVRDDPLMNV